MLIRPPVVRSMRRNLWAGITGGSYPAAAPPAGQPQPPPAQASPTNARMDELRQLGELRDSGVLTEEEFQREKERLLADAG